MSGLAVDRVETMKETLRQGARNAEGWLDHLQGPPTREVIREMISQYYFINRAFVLGIIVYASRIAAALSSGKLKGTEAEEFEDILATVTKIAADECQASDGYSGKNMHHNLLLRMAPKVGLDPAEVPKMGRTEETRLLEELINFRFQDPRLFQGLALVSAVESIALPMIKLLRDYFGRYVPEDGSEPFTAHELEHLDLHIELEVHHAAESSEIYEKVTLDEDKVRILSDTSVDLDVFFGGFWKQFR